MRIPIYQVDAFTNEQFKGNPAAVCLLEKWLSDDLMQKIAKENNLSETAFVVKKEESYELRWFTPENEIDLCGHATLATAYVIFTYINKQLSGISFESKSGTLKVHKEGDILSMIFPSREGEKCDISDEIIKGLGKAPKELYKSRDYMAVFETEEEIKNLKIDIDALKRLDLFGMIVTAKGDNVDFVSRCFAPNEGIIEDPVTGSAHCTLVPYWEKVLNKSKFVARQLSERGGELHCEVLGSKIKISGHVAPYLEGYIMVEE